MKTFLHVLLWGVIWWVLVALLWSNGYMGRYSFVTQDVVTDGSMWKYPGDTNTNLSLWWDWMWWVWTDGSNDLKWWTDGWDGWWGEEMGWAECYKDTIVWWDTILLGSNYDYYCSNQYVINGYLMTDKGLSDGIDLTNWLHRFRYNRSQYKQEIRIIGKTSWKQTLTCKFTTKWWITLSCPYEIEVLQPSCTASIDQSSYGLEYPSNIGPNLKMYCDLSRDWVVIETKEVNWSMISYDSTTPGRYSTRCRYDINNKREELCNSNDYYSIGDQCSQVIINWKKVSNENVPQEFAAWEKLTISCENKTTPTVKLPLWWQNRYLINKINYIEGIIGWSDPVRHITCPYNNNWSKTCHLFIRAETQCGDWTIAAWEECDDGNGIDNDQCTNSCKLTYCGDEVTQKPNGKTNTMEQCDDGNQDNTDLCNNNCQVAVCGDSVIQKPNGKWQIEQCESWAWNDNLCIKTKGSCNLNTCQCVYGKAPWNTTVGTNSTEEKKINIPPKCGNKIVESGEQCDDGNKESNDQCNSMCQYTTCGDGRRQHPNGKLLYEECDDGNKDNTDSCDVNNSCKFTYCGDKILQYPNGKSQYEQCDLWATGANLILIKQWPNTWKKCNASCIVVK